MSVGDEPDFCDEGKLASCFGIASRIRTSKQTERSGRIKALVHTLKNNWVFQDLPNLIWQEVTRRKGLP
jgi:hypothetical protein